MNENEKHIALSKWRTMWYAYISELKVIACSRDFATEAVNEMRVLSFTRVLPSQTHSGTKVTIYEIMFHFSTKIKKKFFNFKLKHPDSYLRSKL